MCMSSSACRLATGWQKQGISSQSHMYVNNRCRLPPLPKVRCLLRVSIYHVSFLRGLFPADMFNGATMNNLGALHGAAWRQRPACAPAGWLCMQRPPAAYPHAPCKPHLRAEHADGATCLPAQVTLAALASLAVSGSRSQHTCPGGVTVQMLGGEGVQLSGDAQQLKDWVEKGAVPPT